MAENEVARQFAGLPLTFREEFDEAPARGVSNHLERVHRCERYLSNL
jgi:hypothetical protein